MLRARSFYGQRDQRTSRIQMRIQESAADSDAESRPDICDDEVDDPDFVFQADQEGVQVRVFSKHVYL